MSTPTRTRTYVNHHLDSQRWNDFQPRDGDIIISTSVKAGTTWMQRILSLLVFGPGELPTSLWQISPWIDARFWGPVEPLLQQVEVQEHQRFLKSHLPFDALPYCAEVRYIMVCRDTRDVFMSLWNHYRAYSDEIYQLLDAGDPPGGPCPRCPDDPASFWRDWMTRAWFDWEPDGFPFWSHHYHAASFWPFRGLDNLLLVHYNDLLADLDGEMRRVAAFVGAVIEEEQWPTLVDAARFESMKRDASKLVPETDLGFRGGAQQFIYKGTNRRWREVLSDADLELYEEQATKLDPELRQFVEQGRLAAGSPNVV